MAQVSSQQEHIFAIFCLWLWCCSREGRCVPLDRTGGCFPMGARNPGRALIAGQAPRGLLVWRIYSYAPGSVSEAARQPLVPLLRTGDGGRKKRAGSWITTDQRNSGLLLSLLAGTETAPPTTPLHLRKYARKQISSCCSSNAHDVDVRCCSEA